MAKFIEATGSISGPGTTHAYGFVSNVNRRIVPRVELILVKQNADAGSVFVDMTPGQAVALANQLVAAAEKADETRGKFR